VGEIGLLLGASESFTLLSLGLFVVLSILGLGPLLGTFSLVLGDSGSLRLLGSSSGSGSLLFGLGGLALLLALGFGVVGIP
jgi:hypothetical protein